MVPVESWPPILEELALEDFSDPAEFLKGYLQATGDGFISYVPLLQALGATPMATPSNGPGQRSAPPRQRPESEQRFEPPEEAPRSRFGEGERRRIETLGGSFDEPSDAAPAVEAIHGSVFAPSEVDEDDDEDDFEVFWARRASAIQHYYNLWDCNQLSNEAFMVQLQELLGNRVHITSEHSEFGKLTNKHRYARNLNFGQLMSALRTDARRCGFDRSSVSLPGSSAASLVGDPAPSEAASESPSHAAGRPTGSAGQPLFGGSRRHYGGGRDDDCESVRSLWSDTNQQATQRPEISARPQQARAPPPYAQVTDLPVRTQREVPRSPAPFASGGNYDQGYKMVTRRPQSSANSEVGQATDTNFPPMDYWSRQGPMRPQGFDGEADIASQYGARSEVSVADSQREEFTLRNRSGHGNILTWGNDSRNITPARKRTGRQLAVDSAGQPRAHATSGMSLA